MMKGSVIILFSLLGASQCLSLRGGDHHHQLVASSVLNLEQTHHVVASITDMKDLTRTLAASHEGFHPLNCNANLASQDCANKTWTSEFGTASTFANEVVIQCGQCITMDYDYASTALALQLQGGLDVQGKLVFPDGYKLSMSTPYVRVQGVWQMRSSKIPNGEEDIKIVITGTDETITSFLPADNNAEICGGSNCVVGKKPFVVAGGQLDVDVLRNDIPTWVNLYDMADEIAINLTSPEYDSHYQAPKHDCSEVLIHEEFESLEGSSVAGTLGSHYRVEDGVFIMDNRTSRLHGVEVDLKDVENCIIPSSSVTYLVTTRVRLTSPLHGNGLPTECTESGKECLEIRLEWREMSGSRRSKRVYKELPKWRSRYGEWITIASEFTFRSNEIQNSNAYTALMLLGPGPSVSLELEEFTLQTPPIEAYPDASHVCHNLVPGNGDADLLGYSPFPFFKNGWKTNLVVKNDGSRPGNPFFAITGRSAYTSDSVGIAFDVPAGCVQKDHVYRFKADVRVNSTDPVEMRVWMKGYHVGNNRTYTKIASCTSSSGDWVTCDTIFTFTEKMTSNSPTRYYVYFETRDVPGVDYDVDSVSFTFIGGGGGIVVTDAVRNKWGIGAQVLLTPHTRNYDDVQVRTITSIEDHSEAGFVTLQLNESITRPTTIKDNPDFAVEVALLSRNVVFEGAKDDATNPRHGAHLIVMHTATDQKLQGVEFRNFGQQGNLGRYPIHLHLCGSLPGTLLAKNLIRQSNQRCIVIHGTHDSTIENNVAFDTAGHCFMTEDGFETGNTFRKNLGSLTRRVQDVIPNSGSNGEETDNKPATYWMTNPSNILESNVAAGSEANGFWYELRSAVRGPLADEYADMKPRTMNLGLFDGNVAHSNADKGLRSYPHGYMPDNTATFSNSRFYRNKNDGLFFHNSRNLAVEGGIFADHRESLDIDRAENITIRDLRIIGISDDYRVLMREQDADDICRTDSWMSGIELHSFTRDMDFDGATIENVTFSGFDGTRCLSSSAFEVDDEIRRGSFDYFTTLMDISLTPGTKPITLCRAKEVGVTDIYIVDTDSSLHPDGTSSFTGTSTIMSDSVQMTTFLNPDKTCTLLPEECYLYCEDTCLRTVTYEIDPAATENYRLQVCSATNASHCIEVGANFYYEMEDTAQETLIENSEDDKYRYLSVSVPPGTYDAKIMDESGSVAWPSFVKETYEDVLCDSALIEGSVTLSIPPLQEGQCEDLIRNGDVEYSNVNHTYWLHRKGGVRLVPGAGIGGSNALGDIVRRDGGMDAIAQHLDTRCFNESSKGRRYEIKAYFQLFEEDTNESYICQPNDEMCPEVGLVARSDSGTWVKEPVASTVSAFDNSGWQLIHGVVEISEELLDAYSVLFYVERNKANGVGMLVDNISMQLMPENNPASCDNLVFNPSFDSGDSRFWEDYDSDGLVIVSPGASEAAEDYALKTLSGSAKQHIRTGCMIEKERYGVSASFKLVDSSGNEFACEPVGSTSDTRCPRMYVKLFDAEGSRTNGVGFTIGNPTAGSWNQIFGVFNADSRQVHANELRIHFGNEPSGMDLIVDDVSIAHLPQDCNQLVMNADMRYGHVRFWDPYGDGYLSNVDGADAIRYSGRAATWNGPEYEARDFMDYHCLTPGSTWQIDARFKLVEEDTDRGASCNLLSTSSSSACPSVVVRINDKPDPSSDATVRILNEDVYSYISPQWNPNDFNDFQGTFTVPSNYTEIDRVSLIVRDFNASTDVIIDSFSITSASS